MTLRLVPALPLLFLMACPGEPEQEPPDDSSPGDSSPGDSGEPQDTGAETGLDTGEPSDWISLPASCEAPGDLGPSAFTEVGEVVLSGVDGMETVYFAEMVDLEVDEENAVAWGVGQGGLVAFGLQEPSQPEFVGYYHAPVGRLYRVELGVDGFIYATHRDSGLFSYDGTDPGDIQRECEIWTPDLAGMARVDDRLYVVSHLGEIVTFSLEDPSCPSEIARHSGLGNAWDILAWGERGYVSDNSLGIGIVDLSEPDGATVAGSMFPGRGLQDLALDADSATLYGAAGGSGVMVFSLEDPDEPELVQTIQLESSVQSVAVSGGRLWAVDQLNLAAFDLAAPRAPRLLGTVETAQWAMHVAAAGERAYVADWGQLSIWEADLDSVAPDLLVGSGTVVLDEASDSVQISLTNLGAGPLELTGATVGSEDVQLGVSSETIESGEQATLRVSWAGGSDLDTRICLASTDPDEPTQELSLWSGETGDSAALGNPAPDFVLQALDGESYQLSAQLGHPVVLVYFATW